MIKKKYGIIGFPLGHSYSKEFFKRKFEEEVLPYSYENFELANINQLPELLIREKNLEGFNVTIPYKVSIIDYLDWTESNAADIGAVNVVKVGSEGDRKKLNGYNSDLFGFTESLKILLTRQMKRALVLGTGGASKAVATGLTNMGIGYTLVSRTPVKGVLSYSELREIDLANYLLIINTTPQGMFPEINSYPRIPYDQLTCNHLLFDLIYNPAETLFLRKGREKGTMVKNGQKMLELQAKRSWEIWNSDIKE